MAGSKTRMSVCLRESVQKNRLVDYNGSNTKAKKTGTIEVSSNLKTRPVGFLIGNRGRGLW
jgi:hypothetical protein